MTNKRRITIFASVIVVVIGVSAAAAMLISNMQNKSSSNTSDTPPGQSALPEASPAEKESDTADKLAYEGDVSGGVKQIDNAIANTTDKEQLYIYYSRKATLLLNHDMLPEAFEAAKKAYDLRTSSDSAALVAQIAQQQGDKQVAVEYYKKAINRLDTTDPFADEDKAYYQSMVSELGGTL